jgi:hypothetical protein
VCGTFAVRERLLIVGTSPLTRRVVEEIARHPRRYKLVGMVEDRIALDRLIAARQPDRIIVGSRTGVGACRSAVESGRGIRIGDVVGAYERLTGKLALSSWRRAAHLLARVRDGARAAVFERALSLLVAIAGLIVLAR